MIKESGVVSGQMRALFYVITLSKHICQYCINLISTANIFYKYA